MRLIKAIELNNLICNQKVVLIDVREKSEHKSERIDSSLNIPLHLVCEDTIGKFHKIVLYCRTGKRSGIAYDYLSKLGFMIELWNLEGGIEAWKSAGFFVEKSES